MSHSLSFADYMPEAENCSDCRKKIFDRLTGLPGIVELEVTRKVVAWAGGEESRSVIEQVLAELKAVHHHRSWIVGGMDCPSCAKSIEKAIERASGVHTARISYARERLSTDFDPALVSAQQLEGIVKGLGYSLANDHVSGANASDEKKKKSSCCSGQAEGHSHELSANETEIAPGLTDRLRNILGQSWSKVALAGGFLAIAVVLSQIWPENSRVFYSVSALIGMVPIFINTLRSARYGQYFGIQTLMTVAAIGALFLGEALEASMVLFLFLIGEALEQRAANKAREGVTLLLELQPKKARLIPDLMPGTHSHEVPAETLSIDDVIEVRPGERLPADGVVLDQMAILDESALTGESIPRNREGGEVALAGALVLERLTRFRVSSEAGDNTLDRIIRLIEESEEHKAPVARFIDRFSSWYTPAMMIVALLVAVLPPLLFDEIWSVWIYKALTLLIISCPCALVISVPAAVTSSLAASARNGLLIKGGAALEILSRAKSMAFDKTGTLTEGKPRVTDVVSLGDEVEMITLAAAVERGSSHPLATAVVTCAEQKSIIIPSVSNAQSITGKAAIGEVHGQRIAVGSTDYFAEDLARNSELASKAKEFLEQGKTVVAVCVDEKLSGILAIRDEPRDTAARVLTELKDLGLETVMLTGDNPKTGAALGQQLGLSVKAGLMPQDKLSEIESLRQSGIVVMVGDGINDAPALKVADVGIAMGGGTDVALEAADIALMQNRLEDLPSLIRRGRATMANIHQNVALALGLKGVFLVTTLLGMTGLWMAVVADTGATVLVTLNALRLLRNRP